MQWDLWGPAEKNYISEWQWSRWLAPGIDNSVGLFKKIMYSLLVMIYLLRGSVSPATSQSLFYCWTESWICNMITTENGKSSLAVLLTLYEDSLSLCHLKSIYDLSNIHFHWHYNCIGNRSPNKKNVFTVTIPRFPVRYWSSVYVRWV